MKFYYKYLLVSMAIFVFATQAHAQELHVTGTVTDSTRAPLPGVNILIKGKSQGTTTNFDGEYAINVQSTDTLVFSYIGYTKQSQPVNGRTIINLELKEDATALNQVVINAGYYNTTQRERTGSISRITAKEIEKQPVNNPLAAMQGRMPGVNIVQNSGAPGGGFEIRIRGTNSLRADGNSPLYIVDGVPYSSSSLGEIQISAGILAGTNNPLNSINPMDIKSIEVLKDADATAIYGSRGANGVVLITTKKGKPGKTKVSINSYAGFAEVTRTMEMMNTEQYLDMRREAYANDGIAPIPSNAYDVNGTWDQNRYTDWQKELIGGTAYFNNLQISLSGGSASTRYLISGTHRKETTVFPGDDDYTKTAVHSNVNHRSKNKRFKLNFSVNYSNNNNNILARDLTLQAYTLPPNAPSLYDDNGDLNWEDGTFRNPMANAEIQYNNRTANLIANTVLSYKILPDLHLKANLGYTETHLREQQTLPSTIYDPSSGITSAYSMLFLNNGARSSWIVEPQLQWKKQWAKHELNFLLGTTFQSQKSTRLSQMGMGFPNNNLINSLAAATTIQVIGDQIATYKYQAFFGRINYNFQKKYILNLTGRRDGSSRFGPGNRFANFGAVGAAWLFSEENFVEQWKWLSLGKLRGSYGTTGNDQIGDYQFLDTYSVSDKSYNGISGLRPTRLFNPEFGWETNRKLEVALELGFLNNRIRFSSAWYRNRSSNQLVGIPLPATTGFSSLQANLDATVQNTGVETELWTENFKNENFSWSTNVNLSIPKNKLIEFKGLEGSTYANTYVVGESVNIIKGYQYIGIDPDTGTYLFKDYDGDGTISSPADRQFINDISPKWFGGLGNHLRYKNFEMEFLFQFVKQKGRNYLATLFMSGTKFNNMPVKAMNHWPQNGTNAEIQRYSTGGDATVSDAYYRYRDSNAIISDASFIRLKSLSLAYRIPTHWSKVVAGKIYLQGQNLFTLTNYKGGDPENQSLSYLPPLRRYTLGVQLNF